MEDEIDALFKLPLGEFTSARNALAARLKKAGEQATADAVKVVPKPSVAAWVVNQLYWHHRKPFDQLIEAGDRFRQVQSAQQTRNAAGVRERLPHVGHFVCLGHGAPDFPRASRSCCWHCRSP